MTPFYRARQSALELRKKLFPKNWTEGISSGELLGAAESEDGEDLVVDSVSPNDLSLGGADALLQRDLRQILVRNDVSLAERGFLVAHEIGHWKLHPEEHEGCHKVVEGTLAPEKAESSGTQKVEAYGARERAELQANTFAKEFLLPRETAEKLYRKGKTASAIAKALVLLADVARAHKPVAKPLACWHSGKRSGVRVVNFKAEGYRSRNRGKKRGNHEMRYGECLVSMRLSAHIVNDTLPPSLSVRLWRLHFLCAN